ncbi:MAG: PaaI family thioesterase [Pontiella sp.]
MDFNDHVGYAVLGFQDNRYVIRLEIAEHHRNRYGIVHGGVLFTMLDTAMSRAFFDTLPSESNVGVTLEMKINYLKAADSGMLTAYGILVNSTRRTAFVEGFIENEAGDLVAKATATMMLTGTSNG